MNTYQLVELLKSDKFAKKTFCGVIPIDKLPKSSVKRPCSFIVNTENSTESGEHWFAIFIPKNGMIEYFDSYGIKPLHKEVYNFIKINGNKFIHNKKCIQNLFSINCGKFCIFYIFFRSRNYSMKNFQNFFTTNENLNDIIVNKLLVKYLK